MRINYIYMSAVFILCDYEGLPLMMDTTKLYSLFKSDVVSSNKITLSRAWHYGYPHDL